MKKEITPEMVSRIQGKVLTIIEALGFSMEESQGRNIKYLIQDAFWDEINNPSDTEFYPNKRNVN